MGRLGQPKSVATEQKVLTVLQVAVDACLGAYPNTLQQDEAELEQLLQQQQQQQQQDGLKASGVDVQQQIRVAMLKGLISEKTALMGSRDVLGEWQQQMAGLPKGVKPEQIAAVYAESDES
jgi:hypothetical protein